MANDEHIAQLNKGVAAWNTWRAQNRNIKQPDLSSADLSETKLSGADLSGADLRLATLLMADLSEARLRGADLRNASLGGAKLRGADLRGADLSGGTYLRVADFSEADLSEARLWRAQLSDARLRGAILRRAELSFADLSDADLSGADLSEATLTEANLCRAQLGAARLSGASLRGAYLRGADLSGADLSGANLTVATLVDTNLTGADLTGCHIYGVSAWGLKPPESDKQKNLVITPVNEAEIRVDDLEVAQFIYLLLNREKVRSVINTVTRRGVLILGRFGDNGLATLQAVAAWLRAPENGGYLPLLFDFPRPDSKTYTETVRTLVSLARFVIVDLSGPSVPQEISATVDLFEIPFVPILEEKRREWSMFRDFLVKDRVLEPVRFTDQDHLLELLAQKVIAPAEKLIEKRQQRLDEIFGRAS